jgi:hypothetical protein
MSMAKGPRMIEKRLAAIRRMRKLACGPSPCERGAKIAAPRQNAALIQTRGESSLTHRCSPPTDGTWSESLTHRDVKNEDCSG